MDLDIAIAIAIDIGMDLDVDEGVRRHTCMYVHTTSAHTYTDM